MKLLGEQQKQALNPLKTYSVNRIKGSVESTPLSININIVQ